MEKIIGLIDAPFTPFYENGEVNYEPIEIYAKMLQKNGLQGVFINGSSGEGYMLTEEERMKLAERWVSVAPAGFKVIVHVGSCCVKASRMLAEHAQKIGATAIGAMAPPFPKIGRVEELVKYIEEIAAGAPELPFYYYHIPAFNGAFLPMVKLLEAVDGRVPNFLRILVFRCFLLVLNILLRVCMSTISAVFIRMESTICFMVRMKRYFLVWLWEVHKVVLAVLPTIMEKNW